MVRIAMLAGLLLAVASCKTQYQPQTVQVTDPGPPQRVLPTIRVLDGGMTPRAPLRYRVPPGQRETLYIELARAEAMQAGSQAAQSGLPPIQLQVKMGPAEPTREGFIRHPVEISQVRVSKVAEKMSPAQREQVEASLARLLQIRGWSEMDVQGRIRRGEFEGADAVSPDMRALLGNIRSALLSVPFPDEPLGVRARWEVERKIQISGVWIDQVVTYHIERIRDGELDLQITARGTAAPQQIPSGRLEAYQSSVIGSASVRLAYFTPHSEAEATTQMRISQPTSMGDSRMIRVERRTAVALYPGTEAHEFEAEEEPAKPEDANVVTDPGQQQLKWYSP
ncbi:MAG: hypothetical protein JSV06_08330 [Myxococcales bacterium]|nr:MAG: hypothetical protein JSV06_08330 [Myxococcales bacterium]